MAKTSVSPPPSSSSPNAIHLPSGDQAGLNTDAALQIPQSFPLKMIRLSPLWMPSTYRPLFCGPVKTTWLPLGDHAAPDSSPAPSRLEAPVARLTTVTPWRWISACVPSGETSGSPKPMPSPNGSTFPGRSARCWRLPSGFIAYSAQPPSRLLRKRIRASAAVCRQPAAPSASSTAASESKR